MTSSSSTSICYTYSLTGVACLGYICSLIGLFDFATDDFLAVPLAFFVSSLIGLLDFLGDLDFLTDSFAIGASFFTSIGAFLADAFLTGVLALGVSSYGDSTLISGASYTYWSSCSISTSEDSFLCFPLETDFFAADFFAIDFFGAIFSSSNSSIGSSFSCFSVDLVAAGFSNGTYSSLNYLSVYGFLAECLGVDFLDYVFCDF